MRAINWRAHSTACLTGELSSDDVVNLLYGIRCDVVHEGMYYMFKLSLGQDDHPEVVHINNTSFATTLRVEELRQIILKGAASASKMILARAKQSAGASPKSTQEIK